MEKLNKIIGEFIAECGIDNMEDLTFDSNLSKIITRHPMNNKYKIHKVAVPLKKSLQYSHDFLETLSPRYADELDSNKDKIIFEKESEATCKMEYLITIMRRTKK